MLEIVLIVDTILKEKKKKFGPKKDEKVQMLCIGMQCEFSLTALSRKLL